MTLNLEKEYEGSLEFEFEKIAEKVVEEALTYENCPYEAEINLLLTTDEEIRKMNLQFRDIDRATDVLSFPMLEYGRPGDFSAAEADDACFDPDSGELELGDIVISVPRMKLQAKEYGHGELREYAFLIAHSMLHLMGYDHMTEEEAKVMEQKQEEILEHLGITR